MVPLQEALVGALALGIAFLLLVKADERAREDGVETTPVREARSARRRAHREE